MSARVSGITTFNRSRTHARFSYWPLHTSV
jgi:hypothetical protein